MRLEDWWRLMMGRRVLTGQPASTSIGSPGVLNKRGYQRVCWSSRLVVAALQIFHQPRRKLKPA